MSRQKKRIKSQKRPTEIIKKVNNKKTKSRKKEKKDLLTINVILE